MEMSEHEKQWLTALGAEMVATLGVTTGSTVVDFGCGIGRYTIPISQVAGKTGKVFAVERTAEELIELRERMTRFGNPDAVAVLNCEDIQLQSIEDGSVDQLLAFDVLQYIDDKNRFFESVSRVLKPKGQVHVYPAAIPHPGAVDMGQIESALNQAGLIRVGKMRFRMMHNKDIVHDDVHTFSAAT